MLSILIPSLEGASLGVLGVEKLEQRTVVGQPVQSARFIKLTDTLPASCHSQSLSQSEPISGQTSRFGIKSSLS